MNSNAPEKIYIQPNAHDGWFEGKPNSDIFVEYVRKDAFIEYTRTDAFIEKAVVWIKEKWDDNYTMPIIIDSVIEDFKNHMKGE